MAQDGSGKAGALILVLISIIMMAASAGARAGQPTIVASIHPLALIVKEIVGEQATVTVLVPPNVSPHQYSMKPSERARLEQAERFVWLGPGMEPFLSNTMDGSGLERKSIALNHKASQSHPEHEHDHGHAAGAEDPHIWLDPDRVRTMLAPLVQSLARVDGLEQKRLEKNRKAFMKRLSDTEATIKRRLETLPSMDLFTYHGAFHHFADHFNLTIAGTLTPQPQRNPGARHLSALRDRIREAHNPCIMTEPQFRADWWQGLDIDQPVRVSHWDPLGTDIEPGVGSYTRFLDQLAEAVIACVP